MSLVWSRRPLALFVALFLALPLLATGSAQAQDTSESKQADYESKGPMQPAINAQERQESRKERRRRRRRERRERWAEMERDRQETQRERYRAEAAQAELEAERLRHQPAPVLVHYQGNPVVVEQFSFSVDDVGGSVMLGQGFAPDPYVLQGRVRGRVPSRRLGLPRECPGFWSNQPQHYVTLPMDMPYVRMGVLSNKETTLAVVTPDGYVWCDDDADGPQLEGQFPAGTYAIYVGTYRPNERTRYSIELSQYRQPVQVAVQGPGVAVQAPGFAVQAPGVSVQVQGQASYTHTAHGQVQPRPHYTGAQRRPQRRPQQPPSCRAELLRQGHSASAIIHCEGAEPYCAAEVLRAGHSPSSLIHCEGVDPQCAVEVIRAGQSPTALIHCQ